VSSFFIIIQYSLGISSQSNKKETRNKRNINKKWWSQTTTICRWHDHIPKRHTHTKKTTKDLLDIKKTFSKVTRYNINLQKSAAHNKETEKEYRKLFHLQYPQKYL
jgi:hypothetical protein